MRRSVAQLLDSRLRDALRTGVDALLRPPFCLGLVAREPNGWIPGSSPCGPGLELALRRCMMPNDSPLKIAERKRAGAENLAFGAEKSRPPCVLVVDDEALLRWSVAETLGDQGWCVTEAADAESALVAFPQIAAASGLVFLDLRLPDSDDLHVLAAMRRLSPQTPVILMTAHGTPDLAEAARALGAFAVINKPFDMAELGPLAERASVCAQLRGGTRVDTTRRTS